VRLATWKRDRGGQEYAYDDEAREDRE
jgi:hypothetical protein